MLEGTVPTTTQNPIYTNTNKLPTIYTNIFFNSVVMNEVDDISSLDEANGYLYIRTKLGTEQQASSSSENVKMVPLLGISKDDDWVSTRDLICWSFQIARGMSHLANKQVYCRYIRHTNNIIDHMLSLLYQGNSRRFGSP